MSITAGSPTAARERFLLNLKRHIGLRRLLPSVRRLLSHEKALLVEKKQGQEGY